MEYFLSALFTSVSVVASILIYDSFFERKYSVKIFSPIAGLFTILIFFFSISETNTLPSIAFLKQQRCYFFFPSAFFYIKGI